MKLTRREVIKSGVFSMAAMAVPNVFLKDIVGNRRIFITGLHRAGTHSFAEYIADAKGINYINENRIHGMDYGRAMDIINKHDNFVLHCPGLAHKTLELAKHGKVYWVVRNKLHVITSMRNASLDNVAWMIMNLFYKEFPKDEIWPTLTYDGSEDLKCAYVQYYEKLVEVKEYFYDKYFKGVAEKVITEEQPYYNFNSCLTSKNPLREHESIRLCQAPG